MVFPQGATCSSLWQQQQKLTTTTISCLGQTSRKDDDVEGGEQQAGKPQPESSFITAARPDTICVYSE